MDLRFLERITWTNVLLQFQVVRTVQFPPFAGSAIRGALGHAFRPSLCDQSPPCSGDCAKPENCRYYSLFERNRQSGDRGPNIPKPMILIPPIPRELEQIALGGPVTSPYAIDRPMPGKSLPVIYNQYPALLRPGTPLIIGLTLLGPAMAILKPVIDFLDRHGLECSGGRLSLCRVVDTWNPGRMIFDQSVPRVGAQEPQMRTLAEAFDRRVPASVRRMRIVFLTPTRVNIGGSICFHPVVLADSFFRHCLVRAMKVHDAFCSHTGTRLPRVDLPLGNVRLIGSRLFHYALPRHSYRQERWMLFDGVVGYLDVEGDLAGLVPLAAAPEVLHIGQKPTFGLGRVRCLLA